MYLSGRQTVSEAQRQRCKLERPGALLQRSGRHVLGDEHDRPAGRVELKAVDESKDVLVLHVLQQLDLVADLRLLSLANAVHDHLAPGDLVSFLLIVAFEDLLERAMAQLNVELRKARGGSAVARAPREPGAQRWV